jgi:hypothetical protein
VPLKSFFRLLYTPYQNRTDINSLEGYGFIY